MTIIDQTGLRGKIRDRPISKELEHLLLKAGSAAGIDTIAITSGGQPGTTGRTTGSTRHNGGRAADLHLIVDGEVLKFTNSSAPDAIKKFVTSAAAHGANGIGAAVDYMGPETLHIGFGLNPGDLRQICWGAKGRSKNAPKWLRDATSLGWNDPPEWAFAADDEISEDLAEEEDEVLETEEIAFPTGTIPKRFTVEVIRAAQATQRRWGVPASITLAQWAIESAYGERMPAGSNNPFGIKALSGQPSVLAWTTEYVNGKKRKVQEPFRVFESLDEAFILHGKLLGTSKYYEKARNFADQPDKFAEALTGIYATDPNYGSLLIKIMRSNNLYAFDIHADGDGDTQVEETMAEPLQHGVVDPIRVTTLQSRLVSLGYKLGKIDGKFGSLTAGALLAFQYDNGLPTTGVVDSITEAALAKAEPRPLDKGRVTASETELAESGSRIVADARKSRVLGWAAGLFGMLGLGNSAIINGAGVAAPSSAQMPEGLLPFLASIQRLGDDPTAAQFEPIKTQAVALSQQLTGASLPPEVIQLLGQVRDVISPEILARNPDIAQILTNLTQAAAAQPVAMKTIFDILPTFVAQDSVLNPIMQGVAAIGSSMLPGFGGSLLALGLGVAGRMFANRIAANRLEDHRSGGNINPLLPK